MLNNLLIASCFFNGKFSGHLVTTIALALCAPLLLSLKFPTGKIKTSNGGFKDKSDYLSDTLIDYSDEEKNIFKKLESLYECARRVSTGIANFIGSVG